MMFVVFVLDFDGINTGYQSCLNSFTVNNEPLMAGIDDCHLTPFIWVTLCDIGVCLFGWIVYRISREYSCPIYNRDESKKQMEPWGCCNGNGGGGACLQGLGGC